MSAQFGLKKTQVISAQRQQGFTAFVQKVVPRRGDAGNVKWLGIKESINKC